MLFYRFCVQNFVNFNIDSGPGFVEKKFDWLKRGVTENICDGSIIVTQTVQFKFISRKLGFLKVLNV